MSAPRGFDCLATVVERACVLEATARKPGNVHPGAAFGDVTHAEFLRAAGLVAPVLAEAGERGVGRTILAAIEATRAELGSNANLGIVLLLAPMCAVPRDVSLSAGIERVLAGLTVEDARLAYGGIRLAEPGGLGDSGEQDVGGEPTVDLREAMRLAAGRDTIAGEYAGGFRLVLESARERIDAGEFKEDWERAVVRLHLRLMAEFPDTLIARKCGWETANESARRAAGVLEAGWPDSADGRRAFAELDGWLRGEGNRRNPGTTADLVAATLFCAFREGFLEPPGNAIAGGS